MDELVLGIYDLWRYSQRLLRTSALMTGTCAITRTSRISKPCQSISVLRSLLSTKLDVRVMAQVPVINALVLSNLCEYRHKSYIPKTRFFWLHFCRHYRSIFKHLDVIGPKPTKCGEITQNKGYYAVRGHSWSPMLVPIKNQYATSYL